MKRIARTAALFMLPLTACNDSRQIEPRHADLAKSGGSPTVRRPHTERADDPASSNDESNDQPVGHFGTVTLDITSEESGNTYTFDAEVDGTTVERVYFPKGGWVDFYDCEVDEDLIGECEDEEGRWWELEGESSPSTSSYVDDEDEDDDEGALDDESDGTEEDGEDDDGQ